MGSCLRISKSNIVKFKYRKRRRFMEIWVLLGAVAVWYVLNRWVLPRFGVQT